MKEETYISLFSNFCNIFKENSIKMCFLLWPIQIINCYKKIS